MLVEVKGACGRTFHVPAENRAIETTSSRLRALPDGRIQWEALNGQRGTAGLLPAHDARARSVARALKGIL